MTQGVGLDLFAKNDGHRGQQQGKTQGGLDQRGGTVNAAGGKMADQQQGQRRGGDAPHGKVTGDGPVHRALQSMRQRAASLRDRGVEEVGADRHGRIDPEQQHQQRCHQRPAANTGQTDDGAYGKAGNGIRDAHDQSEFFVRRIVEGVVRSKKGLLVRLIEVIVL